MTVARRRALAPAGGGLVGAGFYLWIGGARLLNPLEFAWLMRLDWRIHFLGWHLFRSEPWHWPPGRIASYAYPDGTAIIFTDSIPLLALLFKPFAAALPMPFQYIGLWLFTCFVLQGVFGVLLTRVWTSSVVLQLLAAILFVLTPTLLIRVGHPSLCAHFLLLWPLWLYLRDRAIAAGHLVAACAFLGLCAGLVHPYLAVMVMLLLAAFVIRERTLTAAVAFIGAATALVSAWWLSGLFTVRGAENLSSEGLGYYSMNLLGPVTPSGWSAFLPEWPTATGGQAYEGFQYLGAGVLALLLVAATLGVRARRRWQWSTVGSVVVACVLSAMYALSPRVTLGAAVIADWWTTDLDRLALFRATGRFFWPLAYLMLTGAIAIVVRSLPPRRAAMVLAAAAALQLADLRPAHSERRATSRSPAFHTWNSALPSSVWHRILPHYDHLVLVPARQCGSAPIGFEAPAFLAGLHGLTVNSAEVARFNEDRRRAYCARLADEMNAGMLDPRSLYIVDAAHAATLRTAPTPVVCGTIDAALVCVTEDSYSGWRHLAALE